MCVVRSAKSLHPPRSTRRNTLNLTATPRCVAAASFHQSPLPPSLRLLLQPANPLLLQKPHASGRRRALHAPSHVRPAASSDDFGSSFLNSEIVQREMETLMKEFTTVYSMWPKYPGYDLAGKRMYIDAMESVCERLDVFYARASLSDDPVVKEFLTQMSRQLLFASTNRSAMLDGMRQHVATLRELWNEEEKIVDLQQLKAFQGQIAAQVMSTGPGNMHENLAVENMLKDPQVMRVMATHPRAMLAVQELSQQGPAAAEKYRDDKELYSVLMKILSP